MESTFRSQGRQSWTLASEFISDSFQPISVHPNVRRVQGRDCLQCCPLLSVEETHRNVLVRTGSGPSLMLSQFWCRLPMPVNKNLGMGENCQAPTQIYTITMILLHSHITLRPSSTILSRFEVIQILSAVDIGRSGMDNGLIRRSIMNSVWILVGAWHFHRNFSTVSRHF